MRKILIGIVLAIVILPMFTSADINDPTIVQKAAEIGNMYNCNYDSKLDFIAGNIGYSFVNDEQAYALARLLNEKNCFSNVEKSIIAYVSTLNFPSDGIPSGTGADVEQKWLDYWEYTMQRWNDLGYKVIIHPMPFIINDNPSVDTPPGLRLLTKSDLNMDPSEIPVVFECRDGRKTVIASIYDSKTLTMGVEFYNSINSFFSKYNNFYKISIVPPSDFGEYGFPFGIQGSWWQGSDKVIDCYLTGDVYARQIISSDPPPKALYDTKLNEFRQAITNQVKTIFPNKEYMMYFGFGNDDQDRHGFSYEEAVSFAVNNGIDIHSSHSLGLDWAHIPLDKIAVNKPEGYEFTFENAGLPNEYGALINLFHASKYGVTGIEMYPQFLYDYFFTNDLSYAIGSAPLDKGFYFEQMDGLGSLKSTRLIHGFMDVPKDGESVNGDVFNGIYGWAYYDNDDHQNYGVRVYVGHLEEDSQYLGDQKNEYSVKGLHPEYMRLVGSGITQHERIAGNGDLSRFGIGWVPNLASGKAVLRIFIVNGQDEIIAEHPHSPLIINIQSKISGNFIFERLNYNYGANIICSRDYRVRGNVVNSAQPNTALDIIILDEYRGIPIAEGQTDANGNYQIDFTVDSTNGETQYPVVRVYVYLDNDGNGVKDLIGLPRDLTYSSLANIGWYNTIGNKFFTLMDCNWEKLCSNCKTSQCNTYDDCISATGTCNSEYFCCSGSCTKPQPPPPPPEDIPGDLDNDQDIDFDDLVLVSVDFGRTAGFNTRADTNSDNEIDIYDVVYVASRIV